MIPGSAHCSLHRNEAAWLGVGLRADEIALPTRSPRCLPTPNSMEADGGGAGVLSPGGEVPWDAIWSG